jgi:hypothetical protein
VNALVRSDRAFAGERTVSVEAISWALNLAPVPARPGRAAINSPGPLRHGPQPGDIRDGAAPGVEGELPPRSSIRVPSRRGYNLDSHMRLFRHEALRAWSKGQRPRFRQLLAMVVPQPADMCPECQAPADWHTYAVSLRLFQPKPEPGSQAETIARLMPGWWERCPASTSIQIRQQWGQGLPDFDGAQ